MEELKDKKEPRMLIGIPNRVPFILKQNLERHFECSDQHMKKLMPLRGRSSLIMQCNMRQHLVDRYWLHGHPEGTCIVERTFDEEIYKRINHSLRDRTCVQECSEMRSESSEHVWKTKGFLHKQLENQNSLGELL